MSVLTLYHGTKRSFDRFEESSCGSRDDGCSNGALGVWLSVGSDLAESFGDRLDVEADFQRIYRMPINELVDHRGRCRAHPVGDHQYYRDLRANLRSSGYDAVAIVESSGQIGMYVALDLDRLTITARHEPEAPAPSL